jgi:transposase
VSFQFHGGHMQAIPNGGDAVRRRRYYSPELKAEVVAACGQSGKSVAAVATAHGVAPSQARRWIREAQQSGALAPTKGQQAMAVSGFVPVQLAPANSQAKDIRIELRRGSITVNVSWPCEAASDCVAWMRELLR